MSRLRTKPSSALSAYADSIYEEFPDFHFLDGDVVVFVRSAQPLVYRRETGILRIVERKREGEELRRSQQEILPGLADLIRLGIAAGILREGSGVWLARLSQDEYELREVLPGPFARRNLPVSFQLGNAVTLSREGFTDFVRCLPSIEVAA